MAEFTPEDHILIANALFLERTGYQLAEIVGQHHNIFCTNDNTVRSLRVS